MEIRPAGDDDYLCISYHRPEGREDLAYSVQFSTDLLAWEPIDEETTETEWTEDTDGTPVISVRDIAPIEGERRLLRVRVNWLQHEK